VRNTVIALAALVAALLTPTVAVAEGLPVGTPAPNIVGRTVVGSMFIMAKQKAGPKVINFFWVKCIPCKKELPEMARMEKEYPKVQFVAVHADSNPESEVAAFLAALPAHPATIVLAGRKMMALYNFTGFPHTVVLDSNNVITHVISGFTEDNMAKVEQAVKALE